MVPRFNDDFAKAPLKRLQPILAARVHGRTMQRRNKTAVRSRSRRFTAGDGRPLGGKISSILASRPSNSHPMRIKIKIIL
jgi:hypothetical protein